MKTERRAPRALALTLAALAAATLCAPRAGAHKFHTSFAEVNHNAEAGTLEVTLRTFPDDLEAAVRRRAPAARESSGEKDRAKGFEERVAAYVAETFQLKSANGDPIKIAWVGMDAGADSAWLYFEARLPAEAGDLRLSNRFLFDLFDDQINLVNLKSNGKRTALRFERGKTGFQTVSLR
ncbi:MAG TPA: DUF6702 family protein [Pyrinomonadaceae bacterium]|nr:DUF6702 family protein [Pyrinomonadaceae bacterium]